jgi:hypothetical protein
VKIEITLGKKDSKEFMKVAENIMDIYGKSKTSVAASLLKLGIYAYQRDGFDGSVCMHEDDTDFTIHC